MEGRRLRIGLVGCVKGKLEQPAPARDLYVSDLFRGRRRYVEHTCDRWYVLSAKHHLLHPGQVIKPYNVTLPESDRERRAWSARVLEELRRELGDLGAYEFEFHAGDEYRNSGLRDGLDRAGAMSTYPVAGLPYGKQLEFYARPRSPGSPPIPVAEPRTGPKASRLEQHPQRALKAARRLWSAWTGDGIFGHRAMPESQRPGGVDRGSKAHALFVTLTVAIDYMRDAAALWMAARGAYEAEGTRWLFDPAQVSGTPSQAVQEALTTSRVALRPAQDARIWQTVSQTLQERFHGDPRAIAVAADHRGPQMIEELRRVPRAFPWLQGRKIAPLWVRMMADEVGLPLRDLDQVPIPVNVHIARATLACGGLVGTFTGTVDEVASDVQSLWRDSLRGSELYPLKIDQALWLQSREGCSRRGGGPCPREDECVIADLCVAGSIRLDGDRLLVATTLSDRPEPDPVSGDGRASRVWTRILRHAGKPGFLTRQGRDITYDIDGEFVVVRDVKGARIPRDHIERALANVPLASLWDVPQDLWGRSYIFAILMDKRIREDEW